MVAVARITHSARDSGYERRQGGAGDGAVAIPRGAGRARSRAHGQGPGIWAEQGPDHARGAQKAAAVPDGGVRSIEDHGGRGERQAQEVRADDWQVHKAGREGGCGHAEACVRAHQRAAQNDSGPSGGPVRRRGGGKGPAGRRLYRQNPVQRVSSRSGGGGGGGGGGGHPAAGRRRARQAGAGDDAGAEAAPGRCVGDGFDREAVPSSAQRRGRRRAHGVCRGVARVWVCAFVFS